MRRTDLRVGRVLGLTAGAVVLGLVLAGGLPAWAVAGAAAGLWLL